MKRSSNFRAIDRLIFHQVVIFASCTGIWIFLRKNIWVEILFWDDHFDNPLQTRKNGEN